MTKNPIRPVTIASVCGSTGSPELLRLVKEAAVHHPDVIVVPEAWQSVAERMDSPMIQKLQTVAKQAHSYIIVSTRLTNPDDSQTNTALVIDREGAFIGRYDKIYPYWNEFTRPSGVNATPGAFCQPVIDCDFGKLAIFICFDANFPEIWAEAAKQGAELIIWPSAYGAGRQLAAHAINHHYPIVTCTSSGHCMVFDINGDRKVDTYMDKGHYVQWVTLDLDRCIFHENFNTEQLKALLAENPPRVEVEQHLKAEQWILVRSAQEGVSAREVCRAAGMEELRDYKARSKAVIDRMREENRKG